MTDTQAEEVAELRAQVDRLRAIIEEHVETLAAENASLRRALRGVAAAATAAAQEV